MKKIIQISIFLPILFVYAYENVETLKSNIPSQSQVQVSLPQDASMSCEDYRSLTPTDIVFGYRGEIYHPSKGLLYFVQKRLKDIFSTVREIIPTSRFTKYYFFDYMVDEEFYDRPEKLTFDLDLAQGRNYTPNSITFMKRSSRALSAAYVTVNDVFNDTLIPKDSSEGSNKRFLVIFSDFHPVVSSISCLNYFGTLSNEWTSFIKHFLGCDATVEELAVMLKKKNVHLIVYSLPDYIETWKRILIRLAFSGNFNMDLVTINFSDEEQAVKDIASGFVTASCPISQQIQLNQHTLKDIRNPSRMASGKIKEHRFKLKNGRTYYKYTPSSPDVSQHLNSVPQNTSLIPRSLNVEKKEKHSSDLPLTSKATNDTLDSHSKQTTQKVVLKTELPVAHITASQTYSSSSSVDKTQPNNDSSTVSVYLPKLPDLFSKVKKTQSRNDSSVLSASFPEKLNSSIKVDDINPDNKGSRVSATSPEGSHSSSKVNKTQSVSDVSTLSVSLLKESRSSFKNDKTQPNNDSSTVSVYLPKGPDLFSKVNKTLSLNDSSLLSAFLPEESNSSIKVDDIKPDNEGSRVSATSPERSQSSSKVNKTQSVNDVSTLSVPLPKESRSSFKNDKTQPNNNSPTGLDVLAEESHLFPKANKTQSLNDSSVLSASLPEESNSSIKVDETPSNNDSSTVIDSLPRLSDSTSKDNGIQSLEDSTTVSGFLTEGSNSSSDVNMNQSHNDSSSVFVSSHSGIHSSVKEDTSKLPDDSREVSRTVSKINDQHNKSSQESNNKGDVSNHFSDDRMFTDLQKQDQTVYTDESANGGPASRYEFTQGTLEDTSVDDVKESIESSAIGVSKQDDTNILSGKRGVLIGASTGAVVLTVGIASIYRLLRTQAGNIQSVEQFDIVSPLHIKDDPEVQIIPNSLFV